MNVLPTAIRGGLAFCLGLATMGLALGQPPVRTEVRPGGTVVQVRKATLVMGAPVRIQGGVMLGKIEDFVINDTGCIEYMVIAYDDRYVLVPWSVATVNFEQRMVVVDVTRERLHQISFARNSWPNLADAQFRQRQQTIFGAKAAGEKAAPAGDTKAPVAPAPANKVEEKKATPATDVPDKSGKAPATKPAEPPAKEQPKKVEDQKKPEEKK